MKTLEITYGNSNDDIGVETVLHPEKSAREVLSERFHDRCVLKKVEQPRSISKQASYPTTYHVMDRSAAEGREYEGYIAGTLVEID